MRIRSGINQPGIFFCRRQDLHNILATGSLYKDRISWCKFSILLKIKRKNN